MMEDSDPESIARGKVKSELARYPSEKSIENHSNSSPNKQNSIFSLTLDEFQYKSGRSFESMNMDEFLNSVWNVEGNLLSSNSILNEANNDDNNVATSVRLPRQGSCSIPTPFCNKTVEEVWAEISRNQSPSQNPVIVSNDLSERHQTFGEITLEDFLIKVGVIQEPCTPLPAQPNMVDSFQNHCENFSSDDAYMDPGNIGPGRMMGIEFSHPNNENNVQGNGMYQVYTPSGGFGGETSNNITETVKCNGVGAGEPSTRRRTTNGSFELAVERRQRRMIKNRESAARSRARKQAYTAELEIELNQLREENAKLKLVMAEAEDKRKPKGSKGKLLTKAQRSAEKIKTMRRTSSSAW